MLRDGILAIVKSAGWYWSQWGVTSLLTLGKAEQCFWDRCAEPQHVKLQKPTGNLPTVLYLIRENYTVVPFVQLAEPGTDKFKFSLFGGAKNTWHRLEMNLHAPVRTWSSVARPPGCNDLMNFEFFRFFHEWKKAAPVSFLALEIDLVFWCNEYSLIFWLVSFSLICFVVHFKCVCLLNMSTFSRHKGLPSC